MKAMKLLKRCAKTAIRLPFAVAWDCISLANMGEGSSTGRILREHQNQKQLDDLLEALSAAKKALRHD